MQKCVDKYFVKYHYIYKITHKNGRFYIGRHSTSNINDGYLGSGVWVTGIKDKSTLKKEILQFCKNTEELCKQEEILIKENFNHTLCMNRGKGSRGWTSEEASYENKKRIEEGTHNFISGEISRKNQLRRSAEGTHILQGPKNHVHQKIKNGTHHWQTLEHKLEVSERNKKRLKDLTHHFLVKDVCPHCNKVGQGPAMKRWHLENCKNRPVFSDNEAREISSMRR